GSGKTAFGYDFRLYQNYPNPFNPSTTISYKLNSDGFVSLKVYNLIGQEVKTLVDNYQKAGVYKVNFEATEFTSGIYIYKLQMNNSTSVRRMTLLK
ncbi:MAG TPA: T9SS type A sorting domain-containing protein, partial [Ignavibacteria bacterium]|nr:T9SS type A sorting domain-containing protein [Ignavibacteria bacterium]